MPKDSRTPFADLPAPQQAGILCHDPQFQRYAAMRCGAGPRRVQPERRRRIHQVRLQHCKPQRPDHQHHRPRAI